MSPQEKSKEVEVINSRQHAESLSFWQEPVKAKPLHGGITNTNYLIKHQNESYVVRIGEDIPEHGIMRFNELNASIAAYHANISPEVVFNEEGALVIRFIEGKTYQKEDVQDEQNLKKLLPLLKKCHTEVPNYLKAGALCFWVFQVNRNYAGTLKEVNSRYIPQLDKLMKINKTLEAAVGRVNMCFCHNDMLAANFIESNNKIWLIDWDYAGFNSPLFDLSNLASNNGLSIEQEKWLLLNYFEIDVISDKLWRSYLAMKCASLLRESMWSMVSEHYSTLDFDYADYTANNMQVFDKAYIDFLII